MIGIRPRLSESAGRSAAPGRIAFVDLISVNLSDIFDLLIRQVVEF
ncbi:hypothetical protein BN940_06706 [Castellaniella defragrans 65Phen]|uniref:Uncharacterized protein n=1 Tax=Castellaniella defragrans (strain DSM 12143 / CCUG 39792 / 65Phen) TaxID=1437824 RepID=W8WW73_CASD6|nr:hypothetical protein BN940_06706 [Castellaniella defragrans 65Phen]